MLTSKLPGDAPVIWADLFATVVKVHVELPLGVSVPGLQPDSSRSRAFTIVRRIKLIKKDGTLNPQLQVSYVPLSDVPELATLAVDAKPTDLGIALQGRTFNVDCQSGTITLLSDGSAASDQDAQFVKRECLELAADSTRSNILSDVKTGESKAFVQTDASILFSEEIDQFGISIWHFTLRSINPGPPVQGNFDVIATADTSSQAGKIFSNYAGSLTADNEGTQVEMSLKSTSTQSESTFDQESRIVSTSELTIQFKRLIVAAPASAPVARPSIPDKSDRSRGCNLEHGTSL